MRVNFSLIKLVVYVLSNVTHVQTTAQTIFLFFGLSFLQFGQDLVKLPAKRFDVGLRQSQTNLVKQATKQTAITTVTEVL